MNIQLREAIRERLLNRTVTVPAKVLHLGEPIEYASLLGGVYLGFVTRIRPRRREVLAEMWSLFIRHRDGTYSKRSKARVLRSEWVHESQILRRHNGESP